MLKDPHNKLQAVHPELAEYVRQAADQLPFDVLVVCGYRGKADQEAAFKSGNSKAKFGSSPHNFTPALAVDLCPLVNGKPNWTDINLYDQITAALTLIAGREITHGENFKKLVDRPHHELSDWRLMVNRGEAKL